MKRKTDLIHISKILPSVFGDIERRQTLTDAERQEDDRRRAEEWRRNKRMGVV